MAGPTSLRIPVGECRGAKFSLQAKQTAHHLGIHPAHPVEVGEHSLASSSRDS
jgi:hypothetical protein